MNTTKWDKRFIELAKLVGSWSKDPSTKVGAVIVDDDKVVVSLGYNGFPRNVDDSEQRLLDREQKYEIIIHAEANALLHAKRSVKNCTLYTWPFQPCSRCAGLIVQSGIKRVVSVVHAEDRWKKNFMISRKLLIEANIEMEFIDA